MSNYSFSLIEPCDLDWDDIESCPDCTVFHTRQCDNYLASLGRKHFILSIAYLNSPNHRIGYFIATIRYIGIKIMGSPDGGLRAATWRMFAGSENDFASMDMTCRCRFGSSSGDRISTITLMNTFIFRDMTCVDISLLPP